MKLITEFSQPTLKKVLAAKGTLSAEGKTSEEITASIGESFKLEGDKLKFITAAADLIVEKPTARRVLVVSFAEGEAAPEKYQKIEDAYYLVETLELNRPVAAAPEKGFRGGAKGRGGNNKTGGGPKGSPWGASPEEIALKKKASLAAAAAKKA